MAAFSSHRTSLQKSGLLRWCKRYWILLVVFLTAGIYAPVTARSSGEKARQRSLDTLAEVMELVHGNSVGELDPRQVTKEAIQGMLHTLDPHSNYMDEKEFRKMREDQRGTYFGIGSHIQQLGDYVVVVSTVQGGPSEKVGIRAGDIIREVDGKSMEGLSSNEVVLRLRGEKGTVVEVAVERLGFPELVHFSITRAEIPNNSIYYSFMMTPTTGFILIRDFGETTADDFEKAVHALKKQGMKELVLDLRGNTGGLVDAAVNICRQLLGPDQLIVTQKGRSGRDDSETRSPAGSTLDPFPLVVLINRGSASASEIVAGAIQDHDRGLIVGQVSWGKGLVQALMTINRSRGLALTTARYYTPSGRCIQRDYQHGLDDYFLPEDEPESRPAEPQGPAFKTDLGRTVYGGGGITPDYRVESDRLGKTAAYMRFYGMFLKYAVQEKEKYGVKPHQVADDAVLGRFRAWLKGQDFQVNDADWNSSLEDLRDQLTYEMQTIGFGVEAGFRYMAQKDSQIKKALELMPEADQLLKRRMAQDRIGKPEASGAVAMR